MSEKISRRNFMKTSAGALPALGLSSLIEENEAQADHRHVHNHTHFYGRTLYFGRHHTHGYGFFNHRHRGFCHPGIVFNDPYLRMMLIGDHIRRYGAIRNNNVNTNIEQRIIIQEPEKLPQTFIASCYFDKCRDDKSNEKVVTFPTEFIGIGNTVCPNNRPITLGMWFPDGAKVKGLYAAVKVERKIDPSKEFTKENTKFVGQHIERFIYRHIKKGVDLSFWRTEDPYKLTPGSYRGHFFLEKARESKPNNTAWGLMNTINFDITRPVPGGLNGPGAK